MNATNAGSPNGAYAVATSYGWLLVLLVLTFFLTHAYTALANQEYRDQGIREPPRVPYSIPVVGNTLGFVFDTERFLFSITSKFGKIPLRIFVGAEPMYFIPHGQPIQDLFKASRYLTNKPLGTTTVRNAFGCPPADLKIYTDDDSGIDAKPAPGWENVDPSHRFHFIQNRDIYTLLSGPSLNTMTQKFVQVLFKRIQNDANFRHDDWTEVHDLYGVLKDVLIRAAIEALCGEKFLELSPDFPDNFWAFDYHMPKLFKRLPRWLIPKSYRARDKALEGVVRYQEYCRKDLVLTDDEFQTRNWTPEFGTRLMSARQKMFLSLGFSIRGAASLDLGLLWAVNANAIPAAMWMLLECLLNHDIKARVMSEMEPSFIEGSLSFEIDKLCSGPLLTSIYCETLRVRAAAPVGRASLVPNLHLGKWRLKQGVAMLSMSWIAGRDASFWNTGRVLPDGAEEHPLDSFWAERFLQYHDDPTSGPIRKHDAKTSTPDKSTTRTFEDDRTARVVTEGTQGHWYPYGGGKKMCPGRFFAKQEMMAGVAVMLRAFDIELLDPDAAAKVGPNMDYFPFGTIPPNGKVAARIRRRKL
ncbi:hypothetical protein FZEAL_2548 [Fusarium zealandicum]|uniref:Cytochrome P450 n=1 Tax=Fusarium zealandicum TaxID=1053134 RepID=A0A8H4UQW5_9HYPO|nr:hypothetical protein FZEAL_2548 [Fusarium zealandicum]